MKYDVLYNFISPRTGRVLSNPDYVLVGDKDGIATPSPILIDMRLDMIDFRHDLDSFAASSFIISTPNSLFPNAQALSSLTNGFMVNTGGIVSTVSSIPQPDLLYKHIWIGNISNRPVASQTITIDNFPSLGMPLVPVPDPTHGDLVGNVWEGTLEGIPVESGRMASMFADLILINARFATANFIMGSGNIALKTLMPLSQFLDGLVAGILKQDVPGKIMRAVPGVDYVDISTVDFDEGFISLLPTNNDKLIRKSSIRVVDNQDVDRIRTLRAGSINADQNVQAVHNIIANESLGSRELRFYDYATPYVNYVTFKGPALVVGTPAVTWTVPSAAGTDGQVITTDNNNVLSFKNILPNGLNNTLLAQGEVGGKKTFVNATLTQNKIWVGDATNKPVETDLNFAPNDASYILKTPNDNLNSAQALSKLAGGILKSEALTGTISIASGGGTVGVDDYVTPTALTEAIEGVIAEATEAGSVAGGEAGTAAGTAAATAEIAAAMPAILAEAGTAGGTAGGIAGGAAGTAAATLVLLAKESTSDHNADINAVNTRIDNLHIPPSNAKYILNKQNSGSELSQAQVLSDLIGGNYPNGGLLKVTSTDGIIKIASPTVDYADPNKENTFLEKIDFQKNVKFLSKEAIKIPVGNTNERPSNSQVGMVRYNTEI